MTNQKESRTGLMSALTLPNADHEMANRFFEILNGNKNEAITFQLFTEKREFKEAIPKKGKDSQARYIHRKRPFNFDFADKGQKKGAGVWAMVNAGDGKGRAKKNVTKIRALFIDLDGSPWKPAANTLKPHMRVETSPRKWHLYWRVSDCSIEQFTALQKAIAEKYDGDKSCCDTPRVMRVPGFYHLKDEPFMTKLVEADDKLPSYTTQEIIDGLGLDPTSSAEMVNRGQNPDSVSCDNAQSTYLIQTTGEMVNLKKWVTENPGFDIISSIDSRYKVGQINEEKQHITCPFSYQHTDPEIEGGTFIANANSEKPSFTIHCMHNHCADRDRLEFLKAMLENGWIDESILTRVAFELKKPIWVNFPIREIQSLKEWSILKPEVRRIAWDLQYFFWQSDNGTIEDDDWTIAQFLDKSEYQWLEYRETLTRAEWLITTEGNRLTNKISKHEFDKAQKAYSIKCASLEKGRKTIQKRIKEKANLKKD